MEVRFHRLAGKDFLDATRWYRKQSERVVHCYVRALDAALQQICANPQLWPKHNERFRFILLRKFPYALFYEVVDDTIHIVAVAHHRRRPGYWKRRVQRS